MSDGRLVRLFGHHPAVSEGFGEWLADEGASVVFVAGGRIWVVGCAPDGRVDAVDHGLGSPVSALAASADGLLVATWQVWRFVNGLDPGATTPEGHDRLLLPQTAVTVGNIGVCDLFDGPDGIVFASSRLGCLATVDEQWSFQPTWMPPWQSALVDEDRSHLGGVARDEAGRTWVACAGESDVADGWRAGRAGGGCIVGTDGTVIRRGLTLPRTPRAAGDDLLVANAGAGELLAINLGSGDAEIIRRWSAACSALAVHGRWAVIGISAPNGSDYADLPAFAAGVGPVSDGLALVDLETGQVGGTVELEGRSEGVTAVAVVAEGRWPALAVPRGTTARSMVTVGPLVEL
jgi:uncharacterized protein (TIGR03032 family)